MTLTGKDKKHMALIVVVIAIAILAGIFTVHTVRKNNEIREMENQLQTYKEELVAIDAEHKALGDSTVSWQTYFDTTSNLELRVASIAREISGIQLQTQYKKNLYSYALSLKSYLGADNSFMRASFELDSRMKVLDAFIGFIDEEDIAELADLESAYSEAYDVAKEAEISKEKSKKILDKMKNI